MILPYLRYHSEANRRSSTQSYIKLYISSANLWWHTPCVIDKWGKRSCPKYQMKCRQRATMIGGNF